MAKTKISEWSTTPASNTDIDGINIAEGCAPSGINDAIRELMAQLKDFQTGAVGDSFGGPITGAVNATVGATTPNTGAFTTLTTTSNVTLGDAGTDTVLMNGAPSIGGAGYGMGMGFRNRIINGDMRIDQRNAGASYTQVNGQFSLDRWAGNSFDGGAATNKFSVIQSTTAPTGFSNSLLVTSLAATSSGASNIFNIEQKIEGFNFSDFLFGTASAQTLTLSFWVRSSLTGTFGGALKNSARNRAYPFTYTISAANTFEQKTITITGDTSGTWVGGTNGVGLWISFGLGVGSTYSGTAGAWGGGDVFSATGATSVVGTNGATFYITGVQLEKGSTATSFDVRPYGTEFALCQRYYERTNGQAVYLTYYSATTAVANIAYKVTKRAAPTFTLVSPSSGSIAAGTGDINGIYVYITSTPTGFFTEYNASSEV